MSAMAVFGGGVGVWGQMSGHAAAAAAVATCSHLADVFTNHASGVIALIGATFSCYRPIHRVKAPSPPRCRYPIIAS